MRRTRRTVEPAAVVSAWDKGQTLSAIVANVGGSISTVRGVLLAAGRQPPVPAPRAPKQSRDPADDTRGQTLLALESTLQAVRGVARAKQRDDVAACCRHGLRLEDSGALLAERLCDLIEGM